MGCERTNCYCSFCNGCQNGIILCYAFDFRLLEMTSLTKHEFPLIIMYFNYCVIVSLATLKTINNILLSHVTYCQIIKASNNKLQ